MSNRSSEATKRHQLTSADNAIFKNRAQNIEFSFGCVSRSAVLLTPNPPLQFLCTKSRHGPITIAIFCNGLFLLIFEEIWPNYAFGPIYAPNSDSFWLRRLFNVCVRVFCAPNATILLVYIAAKPSVSRSQAHLAKRWSSVYTTIFIWRKDKTNYLSNQTWAKCCLSGNKH